MKTYIDESGDFGWQRPGISLFAAVNIADRSLQAVSSAYERWRTSIGVPTGAEVKGGKLNEQALITFVRTVVEPHRDLWVTLVGVDTRQTTQPIARTFVVQASEVLEAAAARVEREHANKSLGRDLRGMGRWVKRRSAQNGLWLISLARSVRLALQHAIVRHMEPEDDHEFEEWDILIDRSFIHKKRHESFWAAWLRNQLLFESRRDPMVVIAEWAQRDHPYIRKYLRNNDVADMSDLFRNHLRFVDSRDHVGIQIADVCASICRRFFVDNQRHPYELLWPRIVRENTADIIIVHLDERSLRTRSAEAAVHFADPTQFVLSDVRQTWLQRLWTRVWTWG